MSYCPKCGNKVDETMVFCPRCGASLKGTATPGQAPPTQPYRYEKAEKNEIARNRRSVSILKRAKNKRKVSTTLSAILSEG